MRVPKQNLTCSSCHKKVPRNEIIYYGKKENPIKFCPECYKERIERDKFTNYICELFSLRTPGPKMYTQRRRLLDQGYTDDEIIQTLDYLYRICGANKNFESLGLLTPANIDKAKRYYLEKEKEAERIASAAQQTKERVIHVNLSEQADGAPARGLIDIEDFLED